MTKTTVSVVCSRCGSKGFVGVRSRWPKTLEPGGISFMEKCPDCEGKGLYEREAPNEEIQALLRAKGAEATDFVFPRECEITGRWPGLRSIAKLIDHTPAPERNVAHKVVFTRSLLTTYQIAYPGELIRLIGGETTAVEAYRDELVQWYKKHNVVQPLNWTAEYEWPEPLTLETAKALVDKNKKKKDK